MCEPYTADVGDLTLFMIWQGCHVFILVSEDIFMAYCIFHDTLNIQYINFMKYTIYKFPVSKYILCEPDTDGVGGLILLIMGSSSATESSLYWHTTLWLEGADL